MLPAGLVPHMYVRKCALFALAPLCLPDMRVSIVNHLDASPLILLGLNHAVQE